VFVEARFARARSFILVAVEPLGPQRTRLTVLSLAPRNRNPLRPLALEVRRWLTLSFLGQDLERLAGVEYRPDRLVETDAVLAGFLHWLADLPGEGRGREPLASTKRVSTAVTNP